VGQVCSWRSKFDPRGDIKNRVAFLQIGKNTIPLLRALLSCRVARWCNMTKRGKNDTITAKFNKWPKNTSSGLKIYQMSIKYTNISNFKTLQNVPEYQFLV
jgi:hypothetical protein